MFENRLTDVSMTMEVPFPFTHSSSRRPANKRDTPPCLEEQLNNFHRLCGTRTLQDCLFGVGEEVNVGFNLRIH